MKYCPKCNETKAEEKFYLRPLPSGALIRRSYCIKCGKREREVWRANNPKDNERNKKYNQAHASEIRGRKLVKNYWPELTWQEALIEWDKLFQKQNGMCALGHPADKLHVDHCHASGKVRGLLCYNCNNGIGRLKDNPDRLRKAADYLERT